MDTVIVCSLRVINEAIATEAEPDSAVGYVKKYATFTGQSQLIWIELILIGT